MRLFVADEGTGRPIILLHGGLANHKSVRLYAQPLFARYRIIAPDLRGSGQSIYRGELTWDALADDVAEMAKELGVARAVVGGASFGAGVATRVALRHPGLVEALVVLQPAFDGVALVPAQLAAMEAMAAAGQRTLTEGIGALLPLFDALPEAIRERAKAIVATYDPESVASSTRFMASGAQPFMPAELATLAMPVLVAPGTDPQHPREVAQVYAQHVPHATVVETADYAAAITAFVDAL
jgi:pimeloyl-ACP methyl ester carboxylesterase